MKVVLDTNVFISGVLFTGPPFQILEAWRDGKVRLVISPEVFEEYERVAGLLSERYSVDLGPMLDLVVANSELVMGAALEEQVCEDPDDDKFLACALGSRSRVVVSGDRHLLKVSGYKGIRVMRPREFMEKHL